MKSYYPLLTYAISITTDDTGAGEPMDDFRIVLHSHQEDMQFSFLTENNETDWLKLWTPTKVVIYNTTGIDWKSEDFQNYEYPARAVVVVLEGKNATIENVAKAVLEYETGGSK